MRYWQWLLARLLVGSAFLGWAMFALLSPDPGKAEFRRSVEALKKVTSIHASMTSESHGYSVRDETDLVCSDDTFRRSTKIVSQTADKDNATDYETVRSGGHDYELLNNGTWKSGYLRAEAVQTTCKRLAQGTRAWIVPDLNVYLSYGVIDKGDKKKVGDDVCREWIVTMRTAPELGRQTICIGVDDHLPREMSGPQVGTTTYAFNHPVQIDPPSPIAPEPERNTYQAPPPGLTLADDNR